MILALSRAGWMLAFHIVSGVILLSICGLVGITVALALGLPVVEACEALSTAARKLPGCLWASLLAGAIAVGLIDPVRLELKRIGRERGRAVRDIRVLAFQAEGQMEQLAALGEAIEHAAGAGHD